MQACFKGQVMGAAWGRQLGRWVALGVLGGALALGQAQAGTVKKAAPAAKTSKTAKAVKTTKTAAPAKKAQSAKTTKLAPAGKASKKTAQNAPRVRQTVARGKASRQVLARKAVAPAPRPSFGQMAGLQHTSDPLDLKSNVALVLDQETHEVLLSKNETAVLPIASISKLMTGLIISDAHLPLDTPITITQDDVDTVKRSSSRLQVGTTLTRRELLHLALMSSENRAAHALGRTYPGGMQSFVQQMNLKARLLGMTSTRFVEPTGLSSSNQSSAHDLATLVNVAHGDALLRSFSTSASAEVEVGERTLEFRNTNGLIRNEDWDIGLQKTGYIAEAGRCLVMQTQVAGRKLIMVFLDSVGKNSRLGDAQRVRQWVEAGAHRS